MQVLEYSLTWMTSCFIGEGCGATVFGHTNGHGDFVLFDEPIPPWPVHSCYLKRFEFSSAAIVLKIAKTREFPVSLDGVTRLPRHFVPLHSAQLQKAVSVIATVVDIFETIHEWRREMGKPRVYGREAELMYNQLQSSRSVLRLYTGAGEEYYSLVDLRRFPVRFKDVVAARLQPKRLLDDEIFVVLECKRFRSQ